LLPWPPRTRARGGVGAMSGWRCRPGRGPTAGVPFPEPTPPGLNYSVVTGTVLGEPRSAGGPLGNRALLVPLEFPVRHPDKPHELLTLARCEVEVSEALAERSLSRLEVGGQALAGGQLSARMDSSRGVIVATIIHPGEPDDLPPDLLIPGG